jgi:hypothetical protein
MTAETTPKKRKGRTIKDDSPEFLKQRISALRESLEESQKHKRQWEAKADEYWKKIEKLEEQQGFLLEQIGSQKRAYKRLSDIAVSLSDALYSASDALSTMTGGINNE